MTASTRPILGLCMATLAGICDFANTRDAAGFSAADAGVGHRLAEKTEDRWTMADRRAAHRLAIKYRRQLGAAGINVDDLPEVSTDAPADALTARAPGPCSACGGRIRSGDLFIWGREKGSREHADATLCASQPSQSDQSQSSCRLCGDSIRAGELCVDCAMDMADVPVTHQRPAGRVRPSLRHWEDSGRIGPCPLPQPRTALSARDLLGDHGPIAAKLDGYREREGQLQAADTIEQAIRDGEHAAIEAGTGVGKSLAYMVPGLASGHRVLVSTADKALQAQLVTKDVPFLQETMPFPFTAALLKGRGNYVCRQRIAEIDEGVRAGFGGEFAFRSVEAAQTWPELRAWVDETETGDLESVPFRLPIDLTTDVVVSGDECTGRKCPMYGSCFSEGAKNKAKQADLIVVNHALLLRDLDVRAQTGDMASILPNATVLLLDEAHHLADVARDSFAVEVTQARWSRIARRVERLTVKHPNVRGNDMRKDLAETWQIKLTTISGMVTEALSAIAERLTTAKATSQRLGDERPILASLAGCLSILAREMEDGAPAWLEDGQDAESWRKMGRAAGKLGEDIGLLAEPAGGDAMVRYAEIDGAGDRKRIKLICKPIDVADLLRERLFDRFDTVASCSATIATHDRGAPSFDFWKRETGCDKPRELVVGSPFDYPRQSLIYLPADGAAFDPRNFKGDRLIEYQERVADEVQRLILASRGRAFVLFTSYKMLTATHDRLAPRLRDSFTVLRQGDAARPALVRQFKADGNAVLFGTKSFWEGVDVSGEALSMVVIVGLPFAPPDDPMWSARCDAVERRGGKWFFDLALPTAIIALKQGFGRLIRSVDDRGCVALIDGRLTTARYGEGIVRSLPPATRTRSIDAVSAFFGG